MLQQVVVCGGGNGNTSNVGILKVFSLTWSIYMQIYWSKTKYLHENKIVNRKKSGNH